MLENVFLKEIPRRFKANNRKKSKIYYSFEIFSSVCNRTVADNLNKFSVIIANQQLFY